MSANDSARPQTKKELTAGLVILSYLGRPPLAPCQSDAEPIRRCRAHEWRSAEGGDGRLIRRHEARRNDERERLRRIDRIRRRGPKTYPNGAVVQACHVLHLHCRLDDLVEAMRLLLHGAESIDECKAHVARKRVALTKPVSAEQRIGGEAGGNGDEGGSMGGGGAWGGGGEGEGDRGGGDGGGGDGGGEGGGGEGGGGTGALSVSYTHLTLPTICSV
eukprot:2557871-Prymnesium_polylepis.2